MDINLSFEVVNTVLDSLHSRKRDLEWKLYDGIPHGKVSWNHKEILQNHLVDTNEAIQVFEELYEKMLFEYNLNH